MRYINLRFTYKTYLLTLMEGYGSGILTENGDSRVRLPRLPVLSEPPLPP